MCYSLLKGNPFAVNYKIGITVCVALRISFLFFARHRDSTLIAFLPEFEDGSFIASLPLLHQNRRRRINIPSTKGLSLHQFSCESS